MVKRKKEADTEPRESDQTFWDRQAERHQVDGRLCTREENLACWAVVMDVLHGHISGPEGQRRIKNILTVEEP